MGLLDAFKQYWKDASPGGVLNPEIPKDTPVLGLLADPMGSIRSTLNKANAQADAHLKLLEAATNESIRTGRLTGPATTALHNEQGNWILNTFGPLSTVGDSALKKSATAARDAYVGGHTAPMKDKGNAPLHDLTQTYPDDIYSSKAAQYYGHYGQNDPADLQAIAMMQRARGKPDMPVTMYRAVPYEKTVQQQIADLDKQMAKYMKRGTVPSDSYIKGSEWYDNASRMREKLTALADNQQPERLVINNGDWVTLSRNYAKEHGEGALNGNYKIISKKVPARKLFTDGNSIQEFGYDESGKIAPGLLGLLAGGTGAGVAGYNWLTDR